MKKIVLLFLFGLILNNVFAQLDITKRKITLDTLVARGDSIYIKSPVSFKYGSGGSVSLGTDGQVPFMNGTTDLQYSNNFKFTGNRLDLKSSIGNGNIFIGDSSGRVHQVGCIYNVIIGLESGYSLISGDKNTFLGNYTGYNITSGSSNTSIGYRSGYSNISGSANIFLGYECGYYETGSNKLYIENSNSTTPLIYGDFAGDTVRINGTLEVETVTGALIVPRMTTTQRDAMTGINGMIIYNTTTTAFNFFENGSWVTK